MLVSKDHIIYLTFSVSLILIFLITPIVTLKISESGYQLYGADVENVRIYGGWITGKDTRWWGINFAYKFQISIILCVLIVSILSIIKLLSRTFGIINLCLIGLFPIWFFMYLGGVQNNSDGAGLSIHLNIGSAVYLLILIVQLVIVRSSFKQKKSVSH